ncbi:MAG TPA: EpsI family protein [Longimicrobiales bacterium]|nr:EpsI family protein [Longimicrobiales bacterium]
MSRPAVARWAPAVVLALGVVVTTAGARTQRVLPLRSPLDVEVPRELAGWSGRDVEVSEAERRVAGMSSYIMRVYQPPEAVAAEQGAMAVAAEAAAAGRVGARPAGEDAASSIAPGWFTVYVGYYESQAQGRTIHSPKNCLPGGGWEPLTSGRETIATGLGAVTVNRYLIANGEAKSLVLYWYQGRGRVEANEYTVKWDLLRDQALLGRSDEALVRVIVPVHTTEDEAFAQAERVAKQLVEHVDRALPART